MNYLVLEITVQKGEEFVLDLISQQLADTGFESFEQHETTLHAFVEERKYDKDKVDPILSIWPTTCLPPKKIPQENWNELWESNFQPVEINKDVYIRASFHPFKEGFKYELVIDPKMAFGTGHHATTFLMAREMLKLPIKNQYVLDMGCGSGILAILAEKLGASTILAIDIDPISTESTLENATRNNCNKIEVLTGDTTVLPQTIFNVILANINRNVLLEQLFHYAKRLNLGGFLLLSGFYEADLDMLKEECALNKLSFVESQNLDNWVVAKFSK